MEKSGYTTLLQMSIVSVVSIFGGTRKPYCTYLNYKQFVFLLSCEASKVNMWHWTPCAHSICAPSNQSNPFIFPTVYTFQFIISSFHMHTLYVFHQISQFHLFLPRSLHFNIYLFSFHVHSTCAPSNQSNIYIFPTLVFNFFLPYVHTTCVPSNQSNPFIFHTVCTFYFIPSIPFPQSIHFTLFLPCAHSTCAPLNQSSPFICIFYFYIYIYELLYFIFY